jgi:hypothetical protein
MGDDAKRATWVVRELEVVGAEAEEFMQRIEAVPERLVTISGEDLLQQAAAFGQTIEGQFFAYEEPRLAAEDLGRQHYSVKIKAIDGGGFDVVARDESVVLGLLARFPESTWIED